MRRDRSVLLALLAAVCVPLLASCGGSAPPAQDTPPPPQAERIEITSLDQLPQHTYPVDGTASALFADDAAFAAFAAAVREDLERDLATYALDDAATLKSWYGTLANLAMLDGRWDDVRRYLARSRALETKDAARITAGQVGEALALAHEQTGAGSDTPELRRVFREELARRVDAWPWDVVQDEVESRKGRAEYLSANLIVGAVQMQFDPVVARSGELGSDLARSLVSMKTAERLILPLKDELRSVYADYIAANAVAKADIWAERDLALTDDGSLAPVMIGIWDSGVDVAAFPGQVFVNAAETVDGRDDDGNGFVDDVHGVAFDRDGRDSPALLHPAEDQAGRLDELREFTRGFMDLQSNVDSPQAASVRQTMSTLQPEETERIMVGLSFYGLYAHGTHVAGIALAGNPTASVLPARITFDYRNPPQAMTMDIARRHAESYRRTAEYFTAHGVRVVNMSWGWTFKEIESSLEANGVGEGPEERAAMAREMIGVLSDGLREAMASTPDVLYCVAAGNSDSDVEFDVSIPASFDLPNMIVVGAVDQAGDPTDFTSFGENVVVYASGFEVESVVPGGHPMPMSGTSMASPQVCNLAGKLLAVAPGLDPAAVTDLIVQGADPHPGNAEIRLLNPRRSVELAREG
jgi:subtilisin family serine protease